MRNYFILNGKDSRDFGVYISGQGTFGAPAKAYEFYNIPGRNGALIGSEKRLDNIEVSYEAFIYKDFDKNIADFRSYLLSLDGYQRLTDSYHLDEFRMAAYVGPFEPTVERTNDAGSFVITFSCKPQRFLLSGETVYSFITGGGQPVSGASLYLYGARLDPSVRTVSIRRTATPSGNIQPLTGIVLTVDGVNKLKTLNNTQDVYGFRADLLTGTVTVTQKIQTYPTSGWTLDQGGLVYHSGNLLSGMYATEKFDRQTGVNAGDGYIYYQNGNTYVNFYTPFSTQAQVNAYFSQTIRYVVNGSIGGVTLQTFTDALPADWFNYSVADSNANWRDTSIASLTVEYYPNDRMTNPTIFESKPLIRAYGSPGTIDINGTTITIAATGGTYTDIDCDMMDCFEGSTNLNDKVSFSGYDFPVLSPGENSVTPGGGITSVEITPRWWRV